MFYDFLTPQNSSIQLYYSISFLTWHTVFLIETDSSCVALCPFVSCQKTACYNRKLPGSVCQSGFGIFCHSFFPLGRPYAPLWRLVEAWHKLQLLKGMFFRQTVCSQLAQQGLPWQQGNETTGDKAATGHLHKGCGNDSLSLEVFAVDGA